MTDLAIHYMNAEDGDDEKNCTTSDLAAGIYTMVGYPADKPGDLPFVKGPYGYNDDLAEDITWASEGPVEVALLVVNDDHTYAIVPGDKVTIPPGDGGFGTHLLKEGWQAAVVSHIIAAETFPEDAAMHYRMAMVHALALLGREWNPDTQVMVPRAMTEDGTE